MSRIGLNVQAQSPNFDKNKLLAHVGKNRPPWMLVMDGLQLWREIKQVSPNTQVIHRAFPDEEIWHKLSPLQWVNQKKVEIGDANVWCYTVNEMGLSDDLCEWFTQVIELVADSRLKLIIGNMSVGTPAPEDWKRPAVVKLLRALDKHRDHAILAFHEYACGVVTSGILGGWPDNAGVQPGKSGGRNLIAPDNWPTAAEMATLTRFHMGRFKFMLDACKALLLPPPRFLISEHGFDDVSDIKAWSEKLPMTAPYTTIRGWKSCIEAWKRWWGQTPGWSPQRAMFEQLIWADKAIYAPAGCEGQLLYCWGHTSDMWIQFDVSGADELLGLLETYQQATPVPVVTWIGAKVKLKFEVEHANLRAKPDVNSADLGDIHGFNPIEYDSVGVKGGWWHVRYFDTEGYVSDTYFEPVNDEPPPRLPYVPVQANLGGAQIEIIKGGGMVLQAIASNDPLQKVGLLTDGEEVTLYRSTYTMVDNKTWYYLARSSPPVGESAIGWIPYNLPAPPVETLPEPEPPPQYETYGFQINVTLRAETEEAAHALVAYIIQTGAARLQQLKHDAVVMKYLPLIDGAQFSVKIDL